MDLRPRTTESTLPPGGLRGDLRRLRTEGAASAAELREFLGTMRGRSPQEVLGIVTSSGLTRATALATFLVVGLMAVFTVVPYALGRGEAAPATPASGVAAQASPTSSAGAPAASPAATGAGVPADLAAGQPDLEKAAEALGIGETKQAPPDKNPLDGSLDTLLDGLDQ